jgi:hypothetical protein
MVYFQTKNLNLDTFWRALDWKMFYGHIFHGHLEYFMDILYILCPFGIFCVHLVHFFGFGIMFQDKSSNSDRNAKKITVFQISCKLFIHTKV